MFKSTRQIIKNLVFKNSLSLFTLNAALFKISPVNLLLAFFGLRPPQAFPVHPTNLLTIIILFRGKCGLSKCVTRYLKVMAAADLLAIITDVVLYRINDYYLPTSFLFITPVCAFQNVLRNAAKDISVWVTVAFTFDRFVTICCQNLRTKYFTENTASAVIGTICLLFSLKNIHWYFTLEPYVTINNVPWYCNAKLDYYTVPAWVAFSWIHRCLNPLLPIVLILLLNIMTVVHILAVSRVRKCLRVTNNKVNQNDPEMKMRRKSIILLFAISGNFIMLWMLYVIIFLLTQITNNYYSTGLSDPMLIADQTSYMLLLLSCCTNTCIYAVTVTKFKEELKNALTYAPKLILKLVKRGQ
ncbi:probable G-protein coupled receptor 139 [Heterodontus francisci]|uniref:probable G-protein coupled receptor 139 n=1 Tax=Heterodontus francisci TaxID=7792 RepID=UPI00355BAA04